MTLKIEKLAVKWLNYASNAEQIKQFRHSIYIQEQGLSQGVITSEEDHNGLHLAALIDDKIVSIISGFFIHHPTRSEKIMRFGMRMEHKSIRGSGLSELLCTHMGLSCYETIKPHLTYVELFPKHIHLASHYNRWGFQGPTTLGPDQKKLRLVCEGAEQQARQYRLNQRKLAQCRAQFEQVKLPNLTHYLDNHQRCYHQAS